jgi:hypothetical protein
MPSSAYPPPRWACPNCYGVIEEVTYATLPRKMVRGPDGEYTLVTCPLCNRQSLGMAWRVVELTGAEGSLD